MDINKVVGQKVITEDGTLTIMKLDGQYLQLSNGRLYSFVIAFRNGYLKFKEKAVQQEVKDHFDGLDKQKEDETKKQKELEAKFLKEEMEKRRKRLLQKEQLQEKPRKKTS